MFSANLNIYQWDGWDRGFEQFIGPPSLESKSTNTLNWRAFLSETEKTGDERYLHAIWECFRSDVETIPSLKEGIRMRRSRGSPRAEAILDRVRDTEFGDGEFRRVGTGLPEDLDAHLQGLRESVERRSVEEESHEIVPETAQQLEDLGYA